MLCAPRGTRWDVIHPHARSACAETSCGTWPGARLLPPGAVGRARAPRWPPAVPAELPLRSFRPRARCVIPWSQTTRRPTGKAHARTRREPLVRRSETRLRPAPAGRAAATAARPATCRGQRRGDTRDRGGAARARPGLRPRGSGRPAAGRGTAVRPAALVGLRRGELAPQSAGAAHPAEGGAGLRDELRPCARAFRAGGAAVGAGARRPRVHHRLGHRRGTAGRGRRDDVPRDRPRPPAEHGPGGGYRQRSGAKVSHRDDPFERRSAANGRKLAQGGAPDLAAP